MILDTQLFGKYGAVRQIRLGSAKDTRGTAFVVCLVPFPQSNLERLI